MRAFVAVVSLFLLSGFTAVVLADGGIDFGGASAPPGGDYGPPREELIDEWNPDQSHSPVGTYSGGCFAWPYTPPMDYSLERVEFIAGGVGGTVTVQMRADDYNGPILGEVTYTESAETAWQGENLEPCVPLTVGGVYFLVYEVVAGADASTAAGGVTIPYYYASDCSNYSDLFTHIYWKARFYGSTDATPTEANSWGRVKSLYR